MVLCLLQVDPSGVVEWNPSGHLDRVEAYVLVRNTNTDAQSTVFISVIMLASRQALGLSP